MDRRHRQRADLAIRLNALVILSRLRRGPLSRADMVILRILNPTASVALLRENGFDVAFDPERWSWSLAGAGN